MIRNTPKQHIHMNAMKNARNQQKNCQTSVKKTSTLSRPALPYGNAHLEIKKSYKQKNFTQNILLHVCSTFFKHPEEHKFDAN